MTKNNFLSKYIPGVLVAGVFSLMPWFLGLNFPIIGGPIFAIVLGIIGSIFLPRKELFASGFDFVGTKIFQLGIVLLGFSINIKEIILYGNLSLQISLITVTASFILAFFLSRFIGLSGNTPLLLSIGSAISGPNAIGATRPVVKASNDETIHAISIIFLFNIIGAILFPQLASFLNMSSLGFAIFAGTAINDTSSVSAAAVSWDAIHGSNTVGVATVVKLVRTLMIIPVVFVLHFYKVRKEKREGVSETKDTGLFRKFPYFIIFFLLASVIVTYFAWPSDFTADLKLLSRFLVVMAMGAMGLNSNLSNLIDSGFKPVFFAFVLWLGNTVLCLVLQYIFSIW